MSTDAHEAGAGAEAPVCAGAAVRRGVVWNLVNTAFSQGAGIAIFLILSRQLSPEVFGVFALAALLVDLFAIQGRWAAMDALVQRQDFSNRALSSAFWALTGFALLFAGAFALAAGGVAEMVHEPSVAKVLPALALTAPLMPGTAVMDSLLMRNLHFRSQALRNMIGALVGGGVGLFVAFGPAPEWALVARRLASVATTLVVLGVFTRWRPALQLDQASALGFLRRAGQLWLTMLLATAHQRIIEACTGLRAGAGALGLLRVSQRLEEALHSPITGPIQALWVPVLSKIRRDANAAWRLFLELARLAALVAVPAFVGMGLVSKDLVALAFDPRYAGAGDILFLIGMAGFLIPFGFFGNLVFAALDRSELALKFSLASLTVVAPAVWLASAHGAAAALAASIVVMGVSGIIVTAVQIRIMKGRVATFVSFLAPPYLAAGLMALTLALFSYWLPLTAPAERLVCKVALGAVVYVGWLAWAHMSYVRDAWTFLSEVRAPHVGARGARSESAFGERASASP